MKNFHWILIAIVAAIGLWWYFTRYKAVPPCQAGTLPLAPGGTVRSSVYGGAPPICG